jgi:cyanophycinase
LMNSSERMLMKGTALILALILSAAPCFAVEAQSPPKGHLLVVGGGTIPDEVIQRSVQLAGGQSASVAIFPQASELRDTGPNAVDAWKKAGAGRAAAVSLTDHAAAIRAVEEATLIWFPGGDQNRLMKAFAETGVPEAIRRRYREGATVGGTSAGAAVMSGIMITGDADLQSITAGATKTSEGLGLWPEVIFDQHFLKRQRQNRLMSLVLENPQRVGIGIDEQTAVLVSESRFEVIGRSSVVVIDARKAQVNPAREETSRYMC